MKIRINTNPYRLMLYSVYFLFIAAFFRGTAISGFSNFRNLLFVDQLLTLIQYIGIVYICILFIKIHPQIIRCDYLVVSYVVVILIATFRSGVNTSEAIVFARNLIAIYVWFRILFRNKVTMRLAAFTMGLNYLLLINLVFMIVFFGGAQYANYDTIMGSVGHVYLLGYDNGLIMYALPTIVLNYFLFAHTGEKKYITFILIEIIEVVITGSVTGILALLLVGILFNSQLLAKAFSGWRGVLFSVATFVGLITLTVQQWFKPILDYLGKGLTLSGRTEIWGWALSYIVESPIIGWGYSLDRARNTFFWRIGVSAAHSHLLDVLLQGGAIALIIYLAIYVISQRNSLKKYKKTKERIWKLVASVEIAFFFVMIVESYSSYAAYPLLFVLFTMGNTKLKNN